LLAPGSLRVVVVNEEGTIIESWGGLDIDHEAADPIEAARRAVVELGCMIQLGAT
jgi:hypothetical protein